MHVEHEQKMRNGNSDILTEIRVKSLMSDTIVYTKITHWYYQQDARDAHQKMIDRLNGNHKRQQSIPIEIQQQTVKLFH